MQLTEDGKVFTQIVLEIFKLSGLIAADGDRLTKDLGLTSARWKVLGALSMAGEPMTVAKIAKTMGQTRQGVQRIADEMADAGIVTYRNNPNHKRAKFMVLTDKGNEVYKKLIKIQYPWAEEKAEGIELKEMQMTLRVLKMLTQKFEN
ncbi:transcriptional regulator, MarR family [Chloroherpeton thalassium ATCC 35110]|uniref:Transcriptional regulator, MarR family n=1 Tax=Chloroherpeton thalassium (strain ATCC 35110 / GB-78) TaxID=517418 RepID=B3QY80_CHLT3|nr:MarR family transcriptional regulator [Chloroherpeton thalassium]ACF15046.1 transcriptional regulator, MarR family [Chloroherpeton thalassium ATCC 35110]